MVFGKLDVLGHDSDTLGVNSAKVGVLKETHQVGLGRLLQCHHSRRLEAQVGLEVLGNLTHQALEGQFPDEQFGALLVTTDLTKSNGSRPVTMGLLDTTCGGSRLASSLGGQLLTGRLASGGLASSLFGTCHGEQLLNKTDHPPPFYTPRTLQQRLVRGIVTHSLTEGISTPCLRLTSPFTTPLGLLEHKKRTF